MTQIGTVLQFFIWISLLRVDLTRRCLSSLVSSLGSRSLSSLGSARAPSARGSSLGSQTLVSRLALVSHSLSSLGSRLVPPLSSHALVSSEVAFYELLYELRPILHRALVSSLGSPRNCSSSAKNYDEFRPGIMMSFWPKIMTSFGQNVFFRPIFMTTATFKNCLTILS